MDFCLILALGPRNGLDYCVVNQHKVKGEIIIIIIIILIIIIIINLKENNNNLYLRISKPTPFTRINTNKKM